MVDLNNPTQEDLFPYTPEKITRFLKFNNYYSFVMRANGSLAMPRDFVFTDIAKDPHTNIVCLSNPTTTAAGVYEVLATDNSNLEFNLLVDEREFLFRNNCPYLAVPNLPYKYVMPTMWYLPQGTSIKFLADQLHVQDVIVGTTHFPATIRLGGYFVEPPPPEIQSRLFRPMVMVFRHKPITPSLNPSGSVGADPAFKIQSLSLPTDRNFLMRKANFCAIKDQSAGAGGGVVVTAYSAEEYCDFTTRISYNSSFYLTDKTERTDAIIPYHELPLEFKKLMKVVGGNTVVVESTFITGSDLLCNYILVGGVLTIK
jgi:hypothetical protein